MRKHHTARHTGRTGRPHGGSSANRAFPEVGRACKILNDLQCRCDHHMHDMSGSHPCCPCPIFTAQRGFTSRHVGCSSSSAGTVMHGAKACHTMTAGQPYKVEFVMSSLARTRANSTSIMLMQPHLLTCFHDAKSCPPSTCLVRYLSDATTSRNSRQVPISESSQVGKASCLRLLA